MNSNPIIVTHNLTRRFADLVAVNQLSLEIGQGEIFGFLGHNGAGKTTTVRLLNGILEPQEGSVRVMGLSPFSDGPKLRARTGVLTETPALEERLTAQENLTFYADLYDVPRSEVPARTKAILELFELGDRAGQKVGSFSKGMKQRLALARVLLHQPEIIFLDEPSSGLDPVATHQLHDIIQHLSRDEHHTVFLCTHNLAEAQQLCDRVGIMEHGRLVAIGSPADLAHQIQRTFRVELEVAPLSASTAVNVMSNFPCVNTASAENDCLHLELADREAIPDVLAALVSEGIRVYRLTPQEPSLEDVYFALNEQSDVNGAAR